MPAGHVIVVHFAAFEQQRRSVVPTVLYFAASLYLPTVQVTLVPPHLVTSFSQHELSLSVVQPAPVHVVVQAKPAQYVVAEAAINFLPAAHEIDEHFALFEQHAASVLPVIPFLAVSLNLLAPQVKVDPRHLVATVTQQVATSLTAPVVAHALFAQYVFAWAAILALPAGHAMVEHFALPAQQVAMRPSCNVPYVAEFKSLPLPQVIERHLVVSVSQHLS